MNLSWLDAITHRAPKNPWSELDLVACGILLIIILFFMWRLKKMDEKKEKENE